MSAAADLIQLQVFEQKHPDFFPQGTPQEEKLKHIQKIQAKQNDDRLRQIESSRKLDDEVETKQAQGELRDKAIENLKTGDPAEYFLKQYRRLHLGDELVMRLILLTACIQHCDHSFGIQPAADGVKGSGKSSSISSALFLFPQEYVYIGTFSAKALFYAGLRRGTIVFSDDTIPDDEMIGVLKRAMSAFHEPVRHLTLNKERKEEWKEMPPETVFILTSVGTSIDDQLRDRQVIVPIDKNPELDKQYVEFLEQRALSGESPNAVTKEIEVCREMMRIIKSHRFRVAVPFADKIRFSDDAMSSRRAINQFMDYLWGSTILNFQNRKPQEYEGYIQVTATEADFTAANTLFPRSEYQWGLKLSKREKQVFDLIANAGSLGIEESRIVQTLKVDKGGCFRLLHGDKKNNQAGLVDKAPVTFVNEYNKDTGRKNNVWTITRNLEDGLGSFARLEDDTVDMASTENQPKINQLFKTVI